jgi:hypothetical protein
VVAEDEDARTIQMVGKGSDGRRGSGASLGLHASVRETGNGSCDLAGNPFVNVLKLHFPSLRHFSPNAGGESVSRDHEPALTSLDIAAACPGLTGFAGNDGIYRNDWWRGGRN